jgi:hypothetical protein
MNPILMSVLFLTCSLAPDISCARPPRAPGEESGASSVSGKVVLHGYWVAKKMPVYAFTLEQSKPLRELEEQAYSRVHAPGARETETARIEIAHIDALSQLIPKLPRVAKAETGENGIYRFPNLPPGRRYQLVALSVEEDGVYFATAFTPALKPGGKVSVDLRDDIPWEERFRVK